jgi:hypothetical protein
MAVKCYICGTQTSGAPLCKVCTAQEEDRIAAFEREMEEAHRRRQEKSKKKKKKP